MVQGASKPFSEIKITSGALAKLFEAIGGESGLERILVRFYEKMGADLMIGFFFEGKDLLKIALQQKKFLLKAWGVAPSYQGKSPAQAHEELPPILAGHFNRRLMLLAETLREAGLAQEHVAMWLNFEDRFRSAVQVQG